MSVINADNLAVANTAVEDGVNRIFAQGVPGEWQRWTTRRSVTGTSAELNLVDGIPQVREWLGARQFKQLRAYKLNKPLRRWEMSLRVPIDQINAGGPVTQTLSGFAARAGTMYDKIMTDTFTSNPTCYDGQALLSASHPLSASNPRGTTYDNLEAAAISYALFQTAWEAMAERTDFEGEPLDVTPTHLMVGPDTALEAMQITGSDKIVGIGTTGEVIQAGGTGATAGLMIQNYTGGSVDVIVNKRLLGNEWMLMDLSKGDLSPFYAMEFVSPDLTIVDDPESDAVFQFDEVWYGIAAKMTPMAGLPQLVHGSVTT